MKASDEAPRGPTIFGQEIYNAAGTLARMNMILHSDTLAKMRLVSPSTKERENGQSK